jgi:hypothetical protein
MCPSAAHDPHAGDHDARLEAAVVAALDAGLDNLRSFLGALTGADPVLAVETLRRHSSGAHARQVRELLNEAVIPLAITSSELPIPHPLDFAWLFTPETQAHLLNHVRSITRPGEPVVYLGCPTLHHRGLSGLPDRQHLLLDRDARRAARANEYSLESARRLDLLTDALEPMDAVLVVADPPWYPAAAAAFTNAASILMRPGAKLLLAFADSLTRPSADDDLAAVLLSAGRDGLHLVERETGTCRYQMPPYERAAFTAAGFPGIPTDWRLGGLITLRRDERPAPPRRTVAEPQWVGCEIDGIPLRVRPSAPAVGDTLLQPLLDGAILPSVSRRDLRREQAALWTSRNRIYASSDPPALARALSSSERADLPPELRADLAGILATERAEHGLVASAAPSWVRVT